MHKEYYADLLNCRTLDEAKEKYPEFEDVIDAKDINLDKLSHSHILNKIYNGKIENLSLENLSPELLKKQYAEVISVKNKDSYYNISQDTIYGIFNILNIKKLNRNYYYNLFSSNPDVKELHKRKGREAWEKDDGTRRSEYASAAAERLNTPQARAKNLASRRTPESRQKKSESSRAFYQSEAGKLDIAARKEARNRHPEITEMMSKIAEEFPMIWEIRAKKERREEISEAEQKIYSVYWEQCKKAMPGYHQIIMDEYKKILAEWGIKEK